MFNPKETKEITKTLPLPVSHHFELEGFIFRIKTFHETQIHQQTMYFMDLINTDLKVGYTL